MVRKRRTEPPQSGGESSEYQEAGTGRGAQPSAERSGPPQQGVGGGGYQGGRGWGPQSQQQQQQGVGGGGYQGGRGGYGGGRGRGGMQQQQHGGAPEYQSRGRGQPQQGGRGYGGGRSGVGRGGPSSGGFRTPAPELHQATPAPYPAVVTTQHTLSEASSSMQPPEPSLVTVSQQLQQLSVEEEGSSSQAIQPLPASSKSVRFPLRPGKGSTGVRCIVKANHFFAELPDKDLHQYDVSD